MFDTPSKKEECGIFAIYGVDNPANLIYLGLYALQHRGQESAGIVVSNGSCVSSKKGMGLVSDVFKDGEMRK